MRIISRMRIFPCPEDRLKYRWVWNTKSLEICQIILYTLFIMLTGGFMRKLILGASLIFIAALSRLLPHPPNVAPIAAMALAGGVYFERRFALLIPLAALFVSDCIIGFHATIPFVYGSFLATGLIGIWLHSHKKPALIAGGTLLSSIIFFIVTNFGVWLTGGGWYIQKHSAVWQNATRLRFRFSATRCLGTSATQQFSWDYSN